MFGVPVVASTLAAKGLLYKNNLDIFIADRARLFSKRCIQLLQDNDLNREMGQRAKEKAFAQYTWESRMDAIKMIYKLEVG